MPELLPRNNLDMDEKEEKNDDTFAMDDAISKLSLDDYTYDSRTQTIGYKSIFHKANNPSVTSGGSVATMATRGSGRRSSSSKTKSTTYGLSKLGLPYVIDRWHDDVPRSRISVQIHLLSGTDIHEKIQVRVATDKRHLVLSSPISGNMSNPANALKSYMLKQKVNHPVTSKWGEGAMEYMLDKHKKVTARNITISKLNHRDVNKAIVFEDRIPLGRDVHLTFADTTGDDWFFGKRVVRYDNGEVHMHVELLCDTGDCYEVVPVQDIFLDCMGYKLDDEGDIEMEAPNQSPAPNETPNNIPNSVNVRNPKETFEGYPSAFAKSRQEKMATTSNTKTPKTSDLEMVVLEDDAYKGVATRSRSVKSQKTNHSVKRNAGKQDDGGRIFGNFFG